MAIEIRIPRLGWSMEEGTFVEWLKRDGERVEPGEPLFTFEGDKAIQEIEALDGGLLHIPATAPQRGDTVAVGAVIGYLLAPGEPPPTKPRPMVAGPSASVPEPLPAADREEALTTVLSSPPASSRTRPPPRDGRRAISPRAARLAAELGIDSGRLEGTGRGGRIREQDVRAAAGVSATEAAPLSATRRTIADGMLDSHLRTAPVTLTLRADAANLVGLRNQFQAAGQATPVPTYTDIVVRLAAVTLARHPELNARWEGDRLAASREIHVAVAVDAPHGLVAPVLRNVERLSVFDVAGRSRDLVERARAGQLTAAQMEGGTFTVTNLGGLGIEAFTPIINWPQVAILGLGAIRREPVVLSDDRIVPGALVTLSLTFDHRALDGAPAARFLAALRQALENPAAWLLARD
jgi:pyruvate dehydrogenase E2 component (dihydrolipoamide acetyltransferase)